MCSPFDGKSTLIFAAFRLFMMNTDDESDSGFPMLTLFSYLPFMHFLILPYNHPMLFCVLMTLANSAWRRINILSVSWADDPICPLMMIANKRQAYVWAAATTIQILSHFLLNHNISVLSIAAYAHELCWLVQTSVNVRSHLRQSCCNLSKVSGQSCFACPLQWCNKYHDGQLSHIALTINACDKAPFTEIS